MTKSAYIISKPLQYFNVSNIEDDQLKVLFIINGFSTAKLFFEQVKKESLQWNEVYFYDTYDQAFSFIHQNADSFSKIFLDGDYSLSMLKNLYKLRDKKIFVYEEGVGTYTDQIRYVVNKNLFGNVSISKKLKTYFTCQILACFGQKNYHGGSSFTDAVYVYDQKKHQQNKPHFKKELKKFKKSFLQHLTEFEERSILSEDYSEVLSALTGSEVVLYLTSWSIDPDVRNILQDYEGCKKIIKPHPHIADKAINDIRPDFDYVLPGGNMVEFLINDLCAVVSHLYVVHHNSGALLYFKNHAKITEVRI